jgi:hypothetical protein
MEFPPMEVYNYEYGVFGASGNDRELPMSGVKEHLENLGLLKRLSGITK